MYHWTKSCCCCCMQCAHILLLLLLLLIYVTNANGSAPNYQTAYACEGKKLTIECEPGDLINLIRANYGRFSITICNDHGHVDWSVNCMFPRSLPVLASRCAHRQSCSVLATTNMFGDPCPGTHKYLEAHYVCISASQTTTTTTLRPTPPWLKTPLIPPIINGNSTSSSNSYSPRPPVLPSYPPSPPVQPQYTVQPPRLPTTMSSHGHASSTVTPHLVTHTSAVTPTMAAASDRASTDTSVSSSNTRILNGASPEEGGLMTTHNRFTPTAVIFTPNSSSLGSTQSTDFYSGSTIRMLHNNNNVQHANNNNKDNADDGNTHDRNSNNNNFYCGPTNARNLFWNITRVSDVNVQPCPGGATGIAKWRCVLMKRADVGDEFDDDDDLFNSTPAVKAATDNKLIDCKTNNVSSNNCNINQTLAIRLSQRLRNFRPVWHPHTPDLTQCRSLWLNNLEIRVNQGDSSLISIANDLSEVTSSKTLYGGDMLVTTKIIQTMSEKMSHDKETFPDQRQREAVIMELLHGVVKTGSNLLDESQLASWLDLNQEDQMRVATSLLTGLEYSAFLLADTIIRERNVVQKVKNILLTVRVLETKNIQSHEVFPDTEQWPISDDRIEIPRAALVENSEAGLVRIVFAAFDRLESILKPSYDHFDDKSARNHVRNTVIINNDTVTDAQQQRVRILNSKVISASLGKGRHTQLSQPIKLVLRHLRTQNVTNPTCVFWNYIDHAWSENGCTLESTNRTHSICMCNHLTNFAILMDLVDSRGHSLFGMFDGNMRIMIYISVGICLLFILIALLTLKLFNGGVFMKSARTAIYRSIYLCLLFIEILFILGIELTESSMFCCFTTVLLHCSILAGIAWFCFEAYQSYSTLTTDDMLLEVDQSAKVHCYYLLSYGLSLTIVAISSLINPSAYTKNDFCVLMEANALFYITFLAPVFIFLTCALVYTFLSWVIMCRKSRSTLKNKEHTRLANVRFDLRCYFVFLLLLIAVWTSAYNYLRRSKMDDDSSSTYGYLFVVFNTLMGVYMFVFHCIQNEKIRREYGKYVRNHSWLPRCLRCSKTSIASGIQAGGTVGGTLTSHTAIVTSSNHIFAGTQQSLKATVSPHELVTDEAGNIISATDIVQADDIIMASSDCELNETQVRRTAGGTLVTPIMDNATIKSGILPGSLNLQQQQVVLECSTSGSGSGAGASAATTGTLRSIGGGIGVVNTRTPSIGHASPTSSVSSSQLIFAHGHKQQVATPDAYYHHPDFYNWQKGKMRQNGLSPQHYPSTAPQTHEFFYWTQKHNQHGKKKRSAAGGGGSSGAVGSGSNNATMPESPSGSLHSRTTAGSQILYYPSYKKTTTASMKNPMTAQQMQQKQQQYSYAHYAEAMDPYYQQQQQQQQQQLQQQRRISPHAQQQYYLQQQQQLSSDDEQMESHAQLLHLNRRTGVAGPNLTALQLQQQQQHQMVQPIHYQQHHAYATADYTPEQQRYYRNKQSNCDLSLQHQQQLQQHHQMPPLEYNGLGGDFYNHGSTGSDAGGPVYEEILSNRASDVQHYDVGGGDMHEQDLDAVRRNVKRNTRRRRKRRAHVDNEREGERDMESESACDDMNDDNDTVAVINNDNDLNGHRNDHQYEDDDNGAIDSLARADERMRRLMELEDENFRRRFQRQQKKQTVSEALRAPYHNFDGQNATAIFSGDSVRSYKKTSPNGRLAVNDLFNHVAPPLPPANQFPPIQKRQTPQKQQQHQQQQQQHFQQLSPKNVNNCTIVSGPQPQHPIGRNISAMLDENNTVRCYLEPLKK